MSRSITRKAIYRLISFAIIATAWLNANEVNASNVIIKLADIVGGGN